MYERLEKLETLIEKNGFDAAALIPSPNLIWLTGADKHLMERPTTLLVKPGKKPVLIIAGFELGSVENMRIPFEPCPFDDDPSHWGHAFEKAGEYLGLKGAKIAVEPIHFRFQELSYLQDNIENCQILNGQSLFNELRLHKSAEEVQNMRQAAIIAENALEETLKLARPGVSEHELAAELVTQMLRGGSDPTLPFNPIVGSGPNSADPHAEVSDRKLEPGDFLLFDWGARYKGYCSDITRTFAIGEASDKQREVYHTVLAANRAGLSAVRPGVSCGSLDEIARAVITGAGYGEFFTHRLGHGLGLEEHEEPYIFGGNSLLLEKGMSFTDEPGIYLPGDFGVRIEDDVIVTEDGGITTTNFSRELRIL